MKFLFQGPINDLSFGNISVALLREFYLMDLQPAVAPMGNPAVNGQTLPQDFLSWLNSCIAKKDRSHSRKYPAFKLWHLENGFESLSEKQVLFSFYELDSPTPAEVNWVKNNSAVLFSSNYTVDTFKDAGCDNVDFCPLGFDKFNFTNKDRLPFTEERISFSVVGKFEHRKHHRKIIREWIKKYGNNKEYALNCAIYNPHPPHGDKMPHYYHEIVQGNKPFNVNFHNYMQQNAVYNQFLNDNDIVIGMSGGEGWGLPEFHSVAMGKHGVILNAHAYKEWATKENAILVNPSSKIEAYDGIFFHKGAHLNQGNIFDFQPEAFIDGCEKAIARCKAEKSNWDGYKLANVFNYTRTAQTILKKLESIS